MNFSGNTKVCEVNGSYYVVDHVSLFNDNWCSGKAYNITEKKIAYVVFSKESWESREEMEYQEYIAKII